MATISTMAIRILTQHAEAISGLAAVTTAVAGFASEVVRSSSAVQTATAASNAASQAYSATAGEVAKFTGKLLGVATVAAAVSKSIRSSATPEMKSSYERLATAVDGAFKAFGDGFDKAAGLAKVMDMFTAAIRNSTDVLRALGTVMGNVFSIIAACTPVAIALSIAFKVLAVAISIAVQVALTQLIVRMVTYVLLGKAMSTWTLAMTVAKYAWAVACGVATIAINVLSVAMTALMAIGLPFWAALLVIVLVVAVAIAAVVAITWGLVKAWQAFTTDDGMADKIAALDEFQQKLMAANKGINQLTDDLQKQIDQTGMTDKQKKLADFTTEANKERGVRGDALTDEAIERYAQLLEQLEIAKAAEAAIEAKAKAANEAFQKRKDLLAETVKMQDDLDKKLAQAGMTENEKALADFTAKLEEANLLTDKQKTAAIAQYEATLDQIAAEEKRLEIEKQIADLQKSAAQAGMTEAQKKIADLQAAGATAIQIAQAQAALDAKAATEEKAKMMERGKQLKESLATPADEYKKKINEIGKLLAAGAIDPITAMNAADAATKALEDANKAAGAGRDFASPAALLKGSAEAALAEDRQKTPFDRLTDLQRKHLAESQKLTGIAKQQLDAQIKGGVVVNIP